MRLGQAALCPGPWGSSSCLGSQHVRVHNIYIYIYIIIHLSLSLSIYLSLSLYIYIYMYIPILIPIHIPIGSLSEVPANWGLRCRYPKASMLQNNHSDSSSNSNINNHSNNSTNNTGVCGKKHSSREGHVENLLTKTQHQGPHSSFCCRVVRQRLAQKE